MGAELGGGLEIITYPLMGISSLLLLVISVIQGLATTYLKVLFGLMYLRLSQGSRNKTS